MLDLSNNYLLPAYVHNVTLQEIALLPSFPNFSLEEVYNKGVCALNSVLNPETEPFNVPDYIEVKPYYEMFERTADSSAIISVLFNEAKINEETKRELEKLNSIILNPENFDNFDMLINEYIDGIKSDEWQAIETEIICISAANTAIASKNFWVDAYHNQGSRWHFIFREDSNAQSKFRWPRWLTKVLITVACDVVGVALGAALGMIFSPAVALAGAAVVGGGASAAATAFQPKT